MSFSRKDIKNFIRNFNEASWAESESGPMMLNEGGCGCDGDESMMTVPEPEEGFVMGDPLMPETFAGIDSALAAEAPCPDSYNKAMQVFVDIPHEIAEMFQPVMDDLGIDCPTSLAKAMADILMSSQENSNMDY